MKRGQSTHGYGKSKEAVMSYMDKGMTCSQISKACGLSYASVYSVFRRMNLKCLNPNRNAHGYVKEVVFAEHANGLTPSEIRIKHKFNKDSVYSVFKYCGIQYNKKTK